MRYLCLAVTLLARMEPEFKGKYCKIVFAILDDHNAHQSHNPEGNFKPFADEFM